MTFTDAAAEVLRLVGRPLHYKEITDIAIEKNLLSHVGKSPEVTMGARLAATLKKDTSDNPLVRVKPGVFALREWDDKTIKSGMEPKTAGGKGGKKGQRAEAASTDGHGHGHAEKPVDDDDEVLVGASEEEEPAISEDPPTEEMEVHTEGAGEVAEDLEPEVVEAAPVSPAPTPSAPSRPAVTGPAPSRARAHREDDEAVDEEPPGPDDVMRAEAAAGAAEMFDEEEDDDQPILGGDDRAAPQAGEQGDGRRRRRRRRRGRTNGEAPVSGGPSGGLPSYTATPAFEARDSNRDNRDNRDSQPRRDSRDSGGGWGQGQGQRRDEQRFEQQQRYPRADEPRYQVSESAGEAGSTYRPQVIELTPGEGHALDDLAGRELSDAVATILMTFDRNAGAVSLRTIAETAQRRGRLAGDAQLAQSQVAAAVRADNARRIAAGQRPRFRFAGGRVALTDWLLSGDLARLEQEALAAVERYRDAARRAFARKLGELPGHAFVEVCVLALEKLGISQIRALRRAGVPGGESHFSGVLRAAAADELKLALVIRRDGREVGRERVADLRGSLHHYGPANAGWIFTAGQMLSGAREEAAVPGTAPVSLFDGLAVARLCEENDVAVIRARLPVAIPDVDLLEALRAS